MEERNFIMKKINKIVSLIIALALSIMISPSLTFAQTNDQNLFDQVNSTQTVTEPTSEELKKEKEKDFQELENAISSYKESKISKNQLENKLKQLEEKYKSPRVKTNSKILTESLVARATSSSGLLGFSCYMQQQNWYCGPASAYNILKGIGVSTNPVDGRTLNQYNLAVDLGAVSQGAAFTGTWVNTLDVWGNYTCYYSAIWGPSASNIIMRAKGDTILGVGSIYDTYMSGSNQLIGYSGGSRYHYVAGDGYNESTSQVHYLDSNNLNSSAFGAHWISSTMMANCTATRGMVW